MSRIQISTVRVAAPLFLIFLLASCGGPAKSLVSPGGLLEVVNSCGEEIEVFVNGTRVSVLGPADVAKIDRLPSGEVMVLVTGAVTGMRQKRTINLGSSVSRWTVEASPRQRDALALIPTGMLRIENRTDEPVKPFIDGQANPLIWPGADTTFSKISLGKHEVRAEGTKSDLRVDGIIEVKPSGIGIFAVVRPKAALELFNKTAFFLEVFVEDHGRLALPPRESIVVRDVSRSDVGIRAMDSTGRLVGESRVKVVPGKTTTHEIKAPSGVLSVISEIEATILVFDGSRRLGTVAASGGAEFSGLPLGLTELRALDPNRKVVANTKIAIKGESQNLWIIQKNNLLQGRAELGTLVAMNKTSETQRLFVDGADRGQIAARGKRNIPDLVPGKHQVATLGLRSRQVLEGEVQITEGSRIEWVASPMTAPLTLVNDREEEVRVKIDEKTVGVLAPAESKEFMLAEGPHDVVSIGVSSLRTTRHQIDLPASTASTLHLPPCSATIVFINHHGRDLEIGHENRNLGVLEAGTSVTIRGLEPGTHRLFAKATDSPLSWNKLVSLSAGDTEEWVLEQ